MRGADPLLRSPETLQIAGSAPPAGTIRSEGSPSFGRSRRSQPLPPLRTPALEHQPATLGLHPRAEAMDTAAADPARLIGALHACGILDRTAKRSSRPVATMSPVRGRRAT